MTRYCAWLYGVVDDLRKPLNKDEYRVFARVAVVAFLVTAAISLVAFPKWQMGLLLVVFAIPGILLASGLWILLRRRPRTTERPSGLRVISGLAILAGGVLLLRYAIPSELTRTAALLVALVATVVARYVYRRIKGRR